MAKKSREAPEYTSHTYDTGGLFGSSTSTKSGTSFTPAEWQKNTMNVISTNLPNTLSSMMSNDYSSDPNFQAYRDNFNRQAKQNFDNNVLGQLANRGLMRSSGLQAAANSFNNTLNNNYTNLMDSYYNRQANNLANMQNVANTLYSYITGVNSGAQAGAVNANGYGLNQSAANNAAYQTNNALYGNLASTAANLVFS